MSRRQEFHSSAWRSLERTPLGVGQPVELGHHRQAIVDGAPQARTRPVPVSDLRAGGGQTQYNVRTVGRYAARPDKPSTNPMSVSSDAALVVRHGVTHTILDGHHRVLGAIARGDRDVPAKVYDMNQGRFL